MEQRRQTDEVRPERAERTPAQTGGTDPGPAREEKNRALFAHLSSLALFLGVPFGNILGPLVVWLIKKEQSPFVAEHGRESLNFQLSLTLHALVATALAIVAVGFVLLIAVAAVGFVFVVIAAVKADKGETFRYPFTIRFIGSRPAE